MKWFCHKCGKKTEVSVILDWMNERKVFQCRECDTEYVKPEEVSVDFFRSELEIIKAALREIKKKEKGSIWEPKIKELITKINKGAIKK